MPKTTGQSMVSSNNMYDTFTVPIEHTLGQYFVTQIGQGFRYSLNGASTLVIGNLIQAAAENTNFHNMAVQAAVATSVSPSTNGGYPIPVTLGGTATSTTSDFTGGILVISDNTGEGQVFTILGNDVQATTNGTCNFYVLEQPQVALDTTSTADAYHSPYWKVVQAAGPVTAQALGGAVTAPVAANYFFLQVLGPGAVLADGTVTAASTMGLSPSAGTAGAVTKAVNQDAQVGVSMKTVTISTEEHGIFWRCM